MFDSDFNYDLAKISDSDSRPRHNMNEFWLSTIL